MNQAERVIEAFFAHKPCAARRTIWTDGQTIFSYETPIAQRAAPHGDCQASVKLGGVIARLGGICGCTSGHLIMVDLALPKRLRDRGHPWRTTAQHVEAVRSACDRASLVRVVDGVIPVHAAAGT